MPDSHLGLEGGAAESDSHPLPGQSHAHSWARPAVWIVLLLAVCALVIMNLTTNYFTKDANWTVWGLAYASALMVTRSLRPQVGEEYPKSAPQQRSRAQPDAHRPPERTLEAQTAVLGTTRHGMVDVNGPA